MRTVRRQLVVGGVLMLAAVFTCAYVLGEPARHNPDRARAGVASKDTDFVAEDATASRFADAPVLTYQSKDGDLLLALQVQPSLPAANARPRDLVVLIDTTASQAGGPLVAAEKLVEALIAKLSEGDRVSIRTVNVKSTDLSHGFQPQTKLGAALKAMQSELPMGAADLKTALEDAVKSFPPDAGRQQAIIYLGDGMSIRNPITGADLAALADKMVQDHIAFFPVPVGPRLEPTTLHGLASRTGGTPIRLTVKSDMDSTAKQLLATLSVPVLYGATIELPAEITDSLPSKLPPLRGDAPTLLIGHAKAIEKFTYTVKGTVDGQAVSVKSAELKVPAADIDNFFLAAMHKQWQTAKEQPALIRADRALAFALEHHQLARADLIAQGQFALDENRFDIAAALFAQARDLDPTSGEAAALADLVQKLRDGKITKEQLRDAVRANNKQKVGKGERPGADLLAFQPPEKPGQKPEPIAPPVGGDDILQEARRRQAVENQKASALVDDVIGQAMRVLLREPDAARDYLKRTLDAIRTDPNLSAETRERLSRRLEASLADAEIRGERIKRDIAERTQMEARAEDQRRAIAATEATENRIRERMRVFHNLMNQGREEEAYRQAQDIRQDLINQGAPVPTAVVSAYMIGENAYNLKEIRELRRVREERLLLAQLGVERSHIPFPDEPPIQFPPAPTWKAITDLRKGKYESSRLIGEVTRQSEDLYKRLSSPVKFGGFDDPETKLDDVLQYLERAYGFNFSINEQAFKDEMIDNIRDKAIGKAIPKMVNVSLSTVLRKVLERIPSTTGTTWLIRNGEIEITTARYAASEKCVVAYPAADLVIPITTPQQQGSVLQPGQLFGVVGYQGGGAVGGLLGGIAGGLAGGIGGLGGFAALGGIGGLAGLGGIGGIGGLGGLGGIGGQAGVGGGLGGLGGFAGLGGGNPGIQGIQGGGVAGVAGVAGFQGLAGSQGGGALTGFGAIGGTQAPILLRMITQLIGEPDEWGPIDPIQQIGVPMQPGGAPDELDRKPYRNNIAFYPPALSIVVKGSSRIQTRPSPPSLRAPGADMGALDNGGGNFRVANAGKDRDDPAKWRKGPKKDADPKEYWKNPSAFAESLQEPGLIIACADFLTSMNQWDHSAELLKENLRRGVLVRPWVYEALAVALREGKASSEDIERAEVSAADLEPQDAQGYLRAARALKKEHPDAALAFCRQAAILQPGVAAPYQEALAYAKDEASMTWAAGQLLSRDWLADNSKLHEVAKEKLRTLAAELAKAGKKDAADKLLAHLQDAQRRDLELTLAWENGQSAADLDLIVEEPVGSFCSWRNRQTVGGGILLGGEIGSKKQTYVGAEAFPGVYKVSIERVFGHPLGDKAQLRVVRHKGTPQENEEIITISLDSKEPVQVKLDGGRRKHVAEVPPPSAVRRLAETAREPSTNDALSQLQRLADPAGSTLDGRVPYGVDAPGTQIGDERVPDPSKHDLVAYQTRVSPANSAVDVIVQTTFSADRRYVRLGVAPVFNVVSGSNLQSGGFYNPIIPGSPQ